MRIVYPVFLALAFSAPLASAAHAQAVAAAEPTPRGSVVQPPSAEAAQTTPTTAATPGQKTALAQPAKPKVWEPAVIHAETDDSDADSDGVAAVINDFAVSEYEVRQRLNLFLATSGIQPKGDELKRVRGQIITQLENEKLELNEAIKKHITVAPAEVDGQINRMLGDNHVTIEQLREVLANAGSSEDALRRQITAQIAWQKTVQQEYEDRINVTPEEVNEELNRYAEGADRPHYLVSEIFIQVDNPDRDADALKDAQSVEDQLKAGGNFGMIAHQFSQSPSAAAGGDIGYVYEGQLAPELNAALKKMPVNSVSEPVRSIGGYYILALRARQEPLGTKINNVKEDTVTTDSVLPLARLLLPLGAGSTKEMVDSAGKIAAGIRNNFSGCDDLAKVPESLKGAVYMNLGNMRVGDLSPEIQKTLISTHSGEMAQPLISAAGVEMIARCDKKIVVQTAYVLPTRQEVENMLFDQQISAMARRYMRDLRRGVDVEVR
ncbi:MAG TPA: peptidylprolyl isomerase [Rhizomicrobium sp.]|nr:peptidylprolyl isomerase [Rhizomicrobium sp.]